MLDKRVSKREREREGGVLVTHSKETNQSNLKSTCILFHFQHTGRYSVTDTHCHASHSQAAAYPTQISLYAPTYTYTCLNVLHKIIAHTLRVTPSLLFDYSWRISHFRLQTYWQSKRLILGVNELIGIIPGSRWSMQSYYNFSKADLLQVCVKRLSFWHFWTLCKGDLNFCVCGSPPHGVFRLWQKQRTSIIKCLHFIKPCFSEIWQFSIKNGNARRMECI